MCQSEPGIQRGNIRLLTCQSADDVIHVRRVKSFQVCDLHTGDDLHSRMGVK
jgi:hypothetical protein